MSRSLICPKCKKEINTVIFECKSCGSDYVNKISLNVINGYILPDQNLNIDYSEYFGYVCPHCDYELGSLTDELGDMLKSCMDDSKNMVSSTLLSAYEYWGIYTYFTIAISKKFDPDDNNYNEDYELYMLQLYDKFIKYCFENDILIYDYEKNTCADKYRSIDLWLNSNSGKRDVDIFLKNILFD